MVRIIAAVLGGLFLGVALSYFAFVDKTKSPADAVVRDIVDVPKMSVSAAEEHREKRYADLTSIEEIIALPTDFARSEALHALSGRADASRIQDLIFDANRIADEVDRNAALTVLFFRLAELDPQSALALSRTDFFKGDRAMEYTVWRAWARKNLDDALFAAKAQTSTAHRNTAAQSLYAAFGYMGNATTDRIQAELGIKPDRSTRSRFLYLMADRSPAEAIDYINKMESGNEQGEFVMWLAYYLSLRDAHAALRHTNLFTNSYYRQRYRDLVANYAAAEAPREAIERILNDGGSRGDRGELGSAMAALAGQDLDAAMQYFENTRSKEYKQTIGQAIASEMARRDPLEALEWARANRSGEIPFLEMNVLSQIARTDPQLAIAEAQRTGNTRVRQQLLSNVIGQLAQHNPAEATAFVDLIENRQMRDEASTQLASNWIRSDPDAALEWVLGKDDMTIARILDHSAWSLLHSDLDTAIRILPMLSSQRQSMMRSQLAQRLAQSRSPAAAQAFIQEFKGQAGYEQLQSTVISAIAENDPLLGQQMASQLTDARARDSAYAAIVSQQAASDPQAAAAMLSTISSEHFRGQATGTIAEHWHNTDPAAATRWVANLPAGSPRDDAIMRLSQEWTEATREQQALINSIENVDKRSQAKLQRVYNMAQIDPVRARELLSDSDISSQHREHAERMLEQYGIRF